MGTGGQPIAATKTSPAVTNNNLALMVGLGTCGGTDLSTFINVNELTTVATVWALSPFMTGPANIGTSPTNTAGLAAAFAAINEIVTTSTGALPGPTLPAGATLPITEINTLGSILEQCINSAGGKAGDSSNCGNLFSLAPQRGRYGLSDRHNHRGDKHRTVSWTKRRTPQFATLQFPALPADTGRQFAA